MHVSAKLTCPHGRHVSQAPSPLLLVCVLLLQADRLWDPPLLRSQYDGPGGSAHCFVPCRLLHNGRYCCSNLPGALPGGGVDGSAWRPAHLHDHNGTGIPTTAGVTQP